MSQPVVSFPSFGRVSVTLGPRTSLAEPRHLRDVNRRGNGPFPSARPGNAESDDVRRGPRREPEHAR